jgi:hypothetical protein
MFEGSGYGVAVTAVDLSPWPQEAMPSGVSDPGELVPSGVIRRPARLGEMLPVAGRSDADLAAELQRIAQIEGQLAAYKAELVGALAALRPDCLDVPRGHAAKAAEDPADGADGNGQEQAAAHGPDEHPEFDETTEFFADELALVLNCSRTAASTLIGQSFMLLTRLPATWAALADGRLDWPRARGLATELGVSAAETDPSIIAEVEAAILPSAGELSVRGLRAAVRQELMARDAAAAERRRARAERAANVTVRPMPDGMAEFTAFMPAPLAGALKDTVDTYARMADKDGDSRPLGQLRVGVLSDLVLRPWDTSREPVTAHLTVIAHLTRPCTRCAGGGEAGGGEAAGTSPVDAANHPQWELASPEVNGQPITVAQLRALLEQLDALCPGGLRAPAGGELNGALVDPETGALRAVVSRRDLERLARRGCPDHPAGECGCGALDRPPPVDRYQPSRAQRRFVETRDQTCRHPGCHNRAGWADLDHVVPHGIGGQTDCGNLCCLCRRHHRLKTDAPGWRFAMTDNGVLTVTTPSGVTRVTRPPGLAGIPQPMSRPQGTPDDDPPPF